MTKPTRKLLEKEVDSLSLDGYSLSDAAEMINEVIKEYGPDAIISKEQHYYGEGEYWAIKKKVPETDVEMKKRIAEEVKYAERIAAFEAKEFERLQKKFGK